MRCPEGRLGERGGVGVLGRSGKPHGRSAGSWTQRHSIFSLQPVRTRQRFVQPAPRASASSAADRVQRQLISSEAKLCAFKDGLDILGKRVLGSRKPETGRPGARGRARARGQRFVRCRHQPQCRAQRRRERRATARATACSGGVLRLTGGPAGVAARVRTRDHVEPPKHSGEPRNPRRSRLARGSKYR